MVDLDDLAVYKQYDPEGMLDRIHEFPGQCQQAWQQAAEFALPRDYAGVNKVVILGMGGSAIGGDLVSGLLATEVKLPILVSRSYRLPAYIDDKTLVIASSYSGNTEETLTSFEKALKTGAKKLAITTGGKLKEMAESNNVPVFTFSYKAQPRAALPYSFFPILAFMQQLRLTDNKSSDVGEAVEVLRGISEELNEKIFLEYNLAKKLATGLFCHLPVIYGGGFISEVAHRWKTQINENSKGWAFYEAFPELNHNAIVGYQYPVELPALAFVVFLNSNLLSDRLKLRYRVTCQLLEQAKVGYQIVEGRGNSALSQLMSLVLIGDYASYYLAILYQTDPSPVKVIDFLKKELARKPIS